MQRISIEAGVPHNQQMRNLLALVGPGWYFLCHPADGGRKPNEDIGLLTTCLRGRGSFACLGIEAVCDYGL